MKREHYIADGVVYRATLRAGSDMVTVESRDAGGGYVRNAERPLDGMTSKNPDSHLILETLHALLCA